MKNNFTDKVEALIEDLELAVKAAPRSKELFCTATVEKIKELAQGCFWSRDFDGERGELTTYTQAAIKKVLKIKKEV
jgi:hypothetical protein